MLAASLVVVTQQLSQSEAPMADQVTQVPGRIVRRRGRKRRMRHLL
jgi:hypothetical protein